MIGLAEDGATIEVPFEREFITLRQRTICCTLHHSPQRRKMFR